MLDDLREIARRRAPVWFDDPLAFCNDVFREKPREWQPEVLQAIRDNPWVAVAACRKAGKTRLACFVILWFLCTRPNSLVVTSAPTWDQLIQSVWAELHDLWKKSLLPQIYPQFQFFQNEIRTGSTKWRCIGITSDKAENTEGRHAGDTGYVLIVLDESKGIADEFLTSMLGMMGGQNRRHNRLLAIGTPGGPSGWFYRAFAEERHLWGKVFQISAANIPRLAEHCEAERIRLRGGPEWRQQQLAEFTGADEGSIITPAEVTRAVEMFEKWEEIFPLEKRTRWRRILALDPAGAGKDENIITYRYGNVILRQDALPKADTMFTASECVRRAQEFRADTIIIDAVGLGEGIYDRVRNIWRDGSVLPFKSGYKAQDSKRYDNLKSEVVFHLKQLLEDGQIAIPDIPKLRSQLCSWSYTFTARDNRTHVTDPKNDSPDWADSAMMAFAPDIFGGGFGTIRLPI